VTNAKENIMDKLIRILVLSLVILFSYNTATAQIAVQGAEQGQPGEIRAAKATATEGIANYIQGVDISVVELQRPGSKKEFDMRIFVATADGKEETIREETIRSVEVVCPGGKKIAITRKKQDFGGNEHYAVAMREGDGKPLSFAYMNIGTSSIQEYGSGTYSIVINHESGSERISIPSVDPATGAQLERPAFPELTSKLEGTVTSPVSVDFKKIDATANLFLGREDSQSEDFLEVVNRRMQAGETTTGPIELSSGNWGGDIGVASGNSGVAMGVSWSISFSAVVEIDFSVK